MNINKNTRKISKRCNFLSFSSASSLSLFVSDLGAKVISPPLVAPLGIGNHIAVEKIHRRKKKTQRGQDK
jgi:hypothetical protein